jgi:arylsulfatase A-like enzyme
MMATERFSAVAPRSNKLVPSKDLGLRSGLALLSIVALFCLSLEMELLQQIDSLRLDMTTREITLDAAVALLVSLVIAGCWWFAVLLMGQCARICSRNQQFRIHLQWDLWIAPPLAYLILQVFVCFKLEFSQYRQAVGQHVRVLAAVVLTCVCIVGLLRVGGNGLQNFCRTRLVPIAWVHIVIAPLVAAALWMHGVQLFHDYEHPMNGTTVSSYPDIYLITFDALRADDTSVYGYSRVTTPNLEKFAQRSFTFDYFFANSNFTSPTTTTIETGMLPWSHRVFQASGFLRNENTHRNLAAVLKERGYYTAMISSNPLAAPFRHRTLESYDAVQYAPSTGLTGLRLRAFNLIGLNTQTTLWFSLLRFMTTLSAYSDSLLLRGRYPSPAEDVFGRAIRMLERDNGSQPVFLWTHIFPPHGPYWVPRPYRHRFVSERVRNYENFEVHDREKLRAGVALPELRASYDEMILYADHCVGEFLDWLEQTGRLNRSIVIVSADHGELFDHDRVAHGGPELYNGVIRIPLLIHLPGQERSVRVDELSQEADLLPTLLDLIGVPIPSWTEGISLKPALESKRLPDRYVFSMSLDPNRIFDPISKGTVAVVDREFKFVRYLKSGKEELYRYEVDSSEERNLVQSEPQVADRMRNILLTKIEEVNRQFSGRQ